MAAGTPDIKGFFDTLDECVDCRFNDKFFKYADYLSIAKIEDTQIISGRPVSKNVDFLSDSVGQEYYEVTLGSKDSVTTIVRFTYKQFPPQRTVEQEEFFKIFRASVAHMIAVSRLSAQYSYLYNNDIEFGMYNPNYLFTKFDEMFATGVATKYSVAFINIKQLTQLNRFFGSEIAGSAIKLFAKKLNEFIDEGRGEFAVHLGGDNFIVVLITSRLPELETIITSVPVTLAYGVDKFEYVINSRAGITTIKTSHRTGKHVMSECSQAYAYSRKNNIDIVYYSDDINEKNHYTSESLTKALNDHKFLIYYQPIVSLEGKPHLQMAEALARWPLDGKIISPHEFINQASEAGLVTKLDFYVLESVCKNIKSWQSQGFEVVPISINFSGRHFFNTSIAQDILEVIDRYEVDHSLIGIEFSEPDFTQSMPLLKEVSQTLTNAGVLVTLDKFSTGQSTLNILHDLEANFVKIEADRFDPEDSRGRIITNDMINLANILGYKVICEGVSSQKQVDDLQMCGCNLYQSFFYDKPMSERFFLIRLQNPSYENEVSNNAPSQQS